MADDERTPCSYVDECLGLIPSSYLIKDHEQVEKVQQAAWLLVLHHASNKQASYIYVYYLSLPQNLQIAIFYRNLLIQLDSFTNTELLHPRMSPDLHSHAASVARYEGILNQVE